MGHCQPRGKTYAGGAAENGNHSGVSAFANTFPARDKPEINESWENLGKVSTWAIVPQGQPEISQTRSVWCSQNKNMRPARDAGTNVYRNRQIRFIALIRAADAIPEAVGGTADHVHLLVGLRATHSLASLVQDIKQTSSRWIHETIGVENFAWQPGYGAFTVSVSNCSAVKEYIANQAEHHRTKTFQDEYVAFLQKHCLAYEEKYLW
jgi:REP element-mobilizing transposase RayT